MFYTVLDNIHLNKGDQHYGRGVWWWRGGLTRQWQVETDDYPKAHTSGEGANMSWTLTHND